MKQRKVVSGYGSGDIYKFRIVRNFHIGYTGNMEKRKNQRGKIQQIYENNSDGQEHSFGSSHEIKWGKLDNTAHLFPVIAGEGMSNV